MIRVAFLDDHPAVRAGLEVMLASEPDLASVGFADNEEQMWALLERTRPEVVVVDLYHPGSNGLTLSRRITQEPDAPAVVLYSASRDPAVVVAAAVAGANAVVSKSSSVGELLEAIREVTQDHTLPPITRRMSRSGFKARSHRPRHRHAARRGASSRDCQHPLGSYCGDLRQDCAHRRHPGATDPYARR